ncbi:MAG: putative porin [Alistipes sp.]|nr:putative porin [Alistipes sp.]
MQLKRYISILLTFLLLLVAGSASAQLDASALMRGQRNAARGGNSLTGMQNGLGGMGADPNAMGVDGQNGEGQQGEQQDSTKKEKRPRKPLESYFFNDSIRALRNFQWVVDRNTNKVNVSPIDTTLALWRLDYPHYHKRLGNNSVGGLGQASQEVNYFERNTSREFTFARPYEAYAYSLENVPFYNMKHPYIWMTYLESGQKRYREEHFEITASQNINPSTSFSVNYKARGSRGKYDRSRIKNQNIATTFAHTGKRYSIHAAFMHNHIDQQESGGVVGEWAITDTVFEMPSGVPMRLAAAEANNLYKNTSFFVKQSIGIPLQRMTERDFSMADLSAVYIGHLFEYNSWSKLYTDKYATYTDERFERNENGTFKSHTDTYYKDWFLNPDNTRDSLAERLITNRIFVQVQPWDRNGVVGTIDGGIGIDLHTYSQFALKDYLTGKYERVKKTAWFAYAGIDGKVRKYVDYGASFKLYPSGYRGGDFDLRARAAFTAFIKSKPFTLSGEFSQSSTSPGYWMNHWLSNHYMWQNDFSKENETRFNVAFTVPDHGIELGFWQSVVTGKVYYGADCLPAQHSGAVSLTSVYAQKDFTIKGLHLNHRVLVQLTSDREVVPVPLVSAFLSYYYEFWVKRDVLRVQIGVDGRFNTSYYAQGYNPALSVFYNQNEVKIGDYPYLDAFVSAKWKRMRILFKYQHLNKGLFGNGEAFQIARYPLNPGMFKIGISWAFYD